VQKNIKLKQRFVMKIIGDLFITYKRIPSEHTY
jgi:hypothetical protein